MAEETTVLNIRVPRRVAEELKLEAAGSRSSVNRIVGRLLDTHVRERARKQGTREALAEFIGCLHSDPNEGLDSSMAHDLFVQGLIERQREGRL